MCKILKRVMICLFIVSLCGAASLLADRQKLSSGLIRLHVVANSDSEEDQQIKLQVRDAVLNSIQSDLQQIGDIEAAKDYVRENIPKIQRAANAALKAMGMEQDAAVTLCREAFDIRDYDTFSLPGGVYDSLRIIIGDGAGKNWWCVTYPALCVPAAAEDFEAVAAAAGFRDTLADTLIRGEERQVRFFLLDKLGRIQNRLFAGK